MFERAPLTVARRIGTCVAAVGLTLSGALFAQTAPAGSPSPLPKLRSKPAPVAPTPEEQAAVRLMVFGLERKSVYDALNVVRPLLSVQGSVELDPTHSTISVRDNLAALSRVATAIRNFDRESQPVSIDVSLILAETAKISPVRPVTGIAPDILARLKQLLRFDVFSLLARSQISSREGESVVFDMAQGYRLTFELGAIEDSRRVRLSGFRMVRALPGKAEHELVRSVVNLGLDQPLILGLTRDESADRALMLVLRYQRPTALAAGN